MPSILRNKLEQQLEHNLQSLTSHIAPPTGAQPLTLSAIAHPEAKPILFGSIIDTANIIKDHIIQWIDEHDDLKSLSPLQDLLLKSQRDDHGLTRQDIVTALLGLLKTNGYFIKHWLELPQEIRNIGEALLHGRDPPDLTQPLPGTTELIEAKRILSWRFDQQRRNPQPDDPVIKEEDGSNMEFVSYLPFSNWGTNIKNTPRYTFVAKSVVGVQNLVKWAKSKNYRLRCAGFTHTWSNSYSEDGQVLVTLLPLHEADSFPSPESPISSHYLQSIDVVQEFGDHAHVRVGAGTTNEQFRRWAFSQKKWTLPINIVMVEITFGGSNAPICHGAGIRNTTLSDLTVALEYVDSNGVSQVITDPAELKAASGCFGLLGIVTAVTLRVDKMSAAILEPYKPRIGLAIPPPPDYPIPAGVDMKGITPEDLKRAQANFEADCSKDYSEWFWFPYNKLGWVNCWNQSPDLPVNVQSFPKPLDAFIQWIGGWLLRLLIEYTPFKILPGKTQGWLLGFFAMFQLQGGDTASSVAPMVALKSDALHFQRGVQNFAPVNDMELEIPIPEKADGSLDLSVIQRAWWDAISATYSATGGPLRLALEMRLTGGSDVIMSPQRRNKATCSIEILTLANTPSDLWLPYAQQVLDRWSSLVDYKGALLPVRPHWAKMWQGFRFRGVAIERYLTQIAYRNEIAEFKSVLGGITTRTGGSLEESRTRFGNSLYDQIFFSS